MELQANPENALETLIVEFFSINPHPADAQIHALAGALGIDKETLEAVIYKMFGEQTAQQPTAQPNFAATMTERILQDDICPIVAPTNRVSTNDGWNSSEKDEMIKQVTFSDGAPVTKSVE